GSRARLHMGRAGELQRDRPRAHARSGRDSRRAQRMGRPGDPGAVVCRAGARFARSGAMRFKKILCPVDFSDSAHDALLRAVDIAKDGSAELTLIHVYSPPGQDGFLYVPDMLTQLQRSAEEAIAGWVAEAKKLGAGKVSGHAIMGAAWDTIV